MHQNIEREREREREREFLWEKNMQRIEERMINL